MPENKIKYVQLEPGAFLTDIDFQMMDAEQRGVYCSVIFYLYCNNGKIELDDIRDVTLLQGQLTKLAGISGYHKTGAEWDAIWGKIAHKFQITGNILTHKRVTEELKRAAEYRAKKSKAGKAGMASRYGSNTDITKESKVKESKVKQPQYSPIFLKFWQYYPKKTRKREAYEAWQKIDPSEELVAKMLKTLSWQIRSDSWKNEKGRYIPKPSTWLNESLWDDEPNQDLENISKFPPGQSPKEIALRNIKSVKERRRNAEQAKRK